MLEVRWGLLIGLARAIWMLLEYFLGWHGNQFQYYNLVSGFDIVIILVGIPLAIRDKREEELGGYISFRRALRSGLAITAVGAIVSVVFIVIYFNVINPDWADFAANWTRNQMFATEASEKQIVSAVEDARIKFSRGYKMFETAVGVLLEGGLVSFLTAAWFRKKGF